MGIKNMLMLPLIFGNIPSLPYLSVGHAVMVCRHDSVSFDISVGQMFF
jgi:hypothetical protein